MSITVRLWSKEDLEQIGKVGHEQLTTVFLNVTTFSGEELGYYPHQLRRVYIATWDEDKPEDEEDYSVITFYATDDEMALWFLEQEYTRLPDSLVERVTKYRDVIVRR